MKLPLSLDLAWQRNRTVLRTPGALLGVYERPLAVSLQLGQDTADACSYVWNDQQNQPAAKCSSWCRIVWQSQLQCNQCYRQLDSNCCWCCCFHQRLSPFTSFTYQRRHHHVVCTVLFVRRCWAPVEWRHSKLFSWWWWWWWWPPSSCSTSLSDESVCQPFSACHLFTCVVANWVEGNM